LARKPIVQRISLDGGKEIERQLLDIGEAGEKALEQIAVAAAKADLEKFGKSLSKVGSAFGTMVRRIGILTGALSALNLTATGVAAAFFLNSKNAAEYGDAIADAAQKTGLQVEAFQELASAAEATGVSQEQFVGTMTNLSRSIARAAGLAVKGSKQFTAAMHSIGDMTTDELNKVDEAFWQTEDAIARFGTGFIGPSKRAKKSLEDNVDAFQQLGIAVKDANNRLRPQEDILADIADRFAAMPDGARKNALAFAMLGESYADLVPLLNQGSQAFREQGRALEENGLKLTEAQIKISGAMKKALKNLGDSIKGTRVQIGLMFAPVFTQAAEEFRDVINRNRVAIVEFVRTVAVSGIGILHDFFNALRGRDDLVRRPWVQAWTDNIIAFGTALQVVWTNVIMPIFNAIRWAAQKVADGINAIFGTEITGTEILVTVGLLKLLGVFNLITAAIPALVTGLNLLRLTLIGLVGWPALIGVAIGVAIGLIYVFWDDIVAYAKQAWEFIKADAADTWAAMVAVFEQGKQAVVDVFTWISDTVNRIWRDMLEGLGNLVEGLGKRISDAFQQAKDLAAKILDTAKKMVGLGDSGSPAPAGHARGGYIRGPGTATSDSILARLSAGEYVIRAAAVRKFGASFFASLNALRMPKFDGGGFVRGLERSLTAPMIPRYAGGGMVGALAPAGISGRPVNLNFPGGESFALVGPGDVAEKLERFASTRALRSAGRRPGWYR
jgi:hypothetical protein